MFHDFGGLLIKLKRLHPDAIKPTRAHFDDAGYDVYSLEDVIIGSGFDHVFPIGWAVEVPYGMAMLVQEKSGRATRDKLSIGACVIDSSYRGEIGIHIINRDIAEIRIRPGEKIAQVIVVPIWTGEFVEVDELSDTKRGDGGFGSTGLNYIEDPIG